MKPNGEEDEETAKKERKRFLLLRAMKKFWRFLLLLLSLLLSFEARTKDYSQKLASLFNCTMHQNNNNNNECEREDCENVYQYALRAQVDRAACVRERKRKRKQTSAVTATTMTTTAMTMMTMRTTNIESTDACCINVAVCCVRCIWLCVVVFQFSFFVSAQNCSRTFPKVFFGRCHRRRCCCCYRSRLRRTQFFSFRRLFQALTIRKFQLPDVRDILHSNRMNLLDFRCCCCFNLMRNWMWMRACAMWIEYNLQFKVSAHAVGAGARAAKIG